jgi:hypothetical protein
MKSRHNRINFIANGLLFTSALLFAAFSYSEKDEIRTQLDKVKPTVVKYQTKKKEKTFKKREIKKYKENPQKRKTKKTVDIKNQPTNKIKVAKNNLDTANTVTILLNPIDFDSTVTYTPIDIKPDVVDFPDQEAKFKGGVGAMTKFIIHHLNINKMDLFEAENIVVHVEFIIGTEGEVILIKIKGDCHKSIEREIKRMIHSMPNWIPGEFEGRKVNTRMYLPIRIDLQ